MSRTNPERCIYRVSDTMRDVKPEAYRPRMALIGLRNRSANPGVAKDGAGTSNDPGLTNQTKRKYVKVETHKKIYLDSFKQRVGPKAIKKMKKIIEAEEQNIRGSYAESTDWVSPESFVDHILEDSIFIMEFIIRLREKSHDDLITGSAKNTADVKHDLILLENQLPYFIFDQLFGSYTESLDIEGTVEQFILKFFSLERTKKTNFRHFTYMFRCVYEESLEITPTLNDLSAEAIVKMENADSLSLVGVKFKTFSQMENSERDRSHHGTEQPLESIYIRKETDDDYSLRVVFDRDCLVMSCFRAAEDSETILRNVIAFEQCHADVKPFTSNYINFLNFLITTKKDVKVLTAEGT
uniref:UPF0481 protein n=1 Tax=Noccaea caerulescens TaxID=107243 RepID=A0A1J3JJX0_NOCCA